MVGDSDSDIAAGTSAKTKTILVGPVNNHKRQHPELATLHRENFTSAANAILNVTR
jgi:phosphoglycolate phosphatase-like HAD superfamily hydrolase